MNSMPIIIPGPVRTIIQLDGEHTLWNGDLLGLQELIHGRIARGESLVLDFEKTRSIDGAFLGVLVTSWRTARKFNRKIVLCNLDEFCRRLMMLCRLDTIWDLSLPLARADA
jgi:anti-anti-sigma factor